MILKGSQRSGARQLAKHLLRADENEHVEVHEVRGFLSEDLQGALHEAYAVSRGTRCKQYLFSLILSPPEDAKAPVKVFHNALEDVEQKLGLVGHSRVIVFHEKEGRRHAHCVWSRIEADGMKAVNLPFFRKKLHEVSKKLFMENGWQLPPGMVDRRERDPRNFSRAEWQQAKRVEQDPKLLKSMFQECWAASDSRQAFAAFLAERGYSLARGDRRGFVAVDYRGEVYSLSRWIGVNNQKLTARLGNCQSLPSVDSAKHTMATRMTDVLGTYINEAKTAAQKDFASLSFRRTELKHRHRNERDQLAKIQTQRWEKETAARASRLARGVKGIWERITGRYARIRSQNESETYQCFLRDQAQRDTQIERQLAERQQLQHDIKHWHQTRSEEVAELRRDIAFYMQITSPAPDQLKAIFQNAANGKGSRSSKSAGSSPDAGFEL